MTQRSMDFANWMVGIKNIHYHNLDAMARAFDIIESKKEIEESKNNKTK